MRLGDLDNSVVFGTRPAFISPSRRRVSLIVRALLLIRSHSDARPINSHVLSKVNRRVLLLKTEKADFSFNIFDSKTRRNILFSFAASTYQSESKKSLAHHSFGVGHSAARSARSARSYRLVSFGFRERLSESELRNMAVYCLVCMIGKNRSVFMPSRCGLHL